MKRAVVLLSGGLDSATALYWARSRGFRTIALSVRYGQRHARELVAAREVARMRVKSFPGEILRHNAAITLPSAERTGAARHSAPDHQ